MEIQASEVDLGDGGFPQRKNQSIMYRTKPTQVDKCEMH